MLSAEYIQKDGKEISGGGSGVWVSYDEFKLVLDQVLGIWIRKRISNAQAMWCAMANVYWKDPCGNIAAFSFRVAGQMIADIYGKETNYLDYYCSGEDGVVDPVIGKAMAAKGWTWERR
jgi:hypothetical protein